MAAAAVEVPDQSRMLILVFASQEDVYMKRKHKAKDTSFDLAKMLRWRWREMGGLDVLTGNKDFCLRPIWVAMGGERESQGNAEQHRRRSQGSRRPRQDRSQEGRRRQPQSRASQQDSGNETHTPLPQRPGQAAAEFRPEPLDW